MQRFVTYLESFDATQLRRLFAHQDVSVAVLRSLAPLERQLAMRLLLLNAGGDAVRPVSLRGVVERWSESSETARAAAQRLLKLGILERVDGGVGNAATDADDALLLLDETAERAVKLCDSFAGALRRLLLLPSGVGGGSGSGGDGIGAAPPTLDVERVERAKSHADVRWRSLIALLVNVQLDDAPPVAQSIVDLLVRSGLARHVNSASSSSSSTPNSLRITHRGFQFLLDGQASQLWTLLLAHLAAATYASDADRAAALSLLFSLARTPYGGELVDAGASLASDARRELLTTLDALGLVWLADSRDGGALCAIATPLAALLVSVPRAGGGGGGASDDVLDGATPQPLSSLDKALDVASLNATTTTSSSSMSSTSSSLADTSSAGHIIVETNFKLYAYTSSPLDIAVISLFAAPAVRLPNLCVAAITRDSVVRAASRAAPPRSA